MILALCFITPVVKDTQLLTTANILNILQQASPRIFLALGVAGLILLTGTDLSVGRMVGMGVVAGSFVGWTMAYFRLRWVEKNMDAHIFCSGSLIPRGKGAKPSAKAYDRTQKQLQEQ